MKAHKWVAWLWLLSSPSVASPFPRERVGIARLGGPLGGEDERAFALIRGRLKQWLENLPSPIEVSGEYFAVHSEALVWQHKSDFLSEQSRKALVSAFETGQPAVRLDELRALRKGLEGFGQFGPSVQLGLVAEAAQEWRRDNRTLSDNLLKDAGLLHPDGALDVELGDLGGMDAGAVASFEGRIALHGHEPKGSCLLELLLHPEDALVTVNGFSFSERRQFHLKPMTQYTFLVGARGHFSEQRHFTCRSGGKHSLAIRLKRSFGENAAYPSLYSLMETEGVDSLILIEPIEGVFHVSWYEPGRRVRELRSQRRLVTREILKDPAAFDLHLVWEGALSAPPANRSVLPVAPAIPALVESEGPRWYNNSAFWVVAGGLALGSILLLAASREGEKTKVPEARGISIQWE